MRASINKLVAMFAAAIVATACLGFAGTHTERGANITLASRIKLSNGQMLPAGNYRMEVAENSPMPTVRFYKESLSTGYWGGRAMALTNAQVVTEAQKNKRTVIDSVQRGDAQLLQVIQPRGWHERLLFTPNGTENRQG